MVYRLYVEKKPGFRQEAESLARDIRSFLRIEALEALRLVNRYDVEGISSDLLEDCSTTVFSEPQLDDVYDALPDDGSPAVFAVEPLPGQFDQRADSAAQCVQLASAGERPTVRTAKVYLLYGALSGDQLKEIKGYLMNPVDSREAALALPDTLRLRVDAPEPVKVVEGFINLPDEALAAMRAAWGLAMDVEDLKCCRAYFQGEKRDPTATELRLLDTYWSDHCRHTTFLTAIEQAEVDDERVRASLSRAQALREELGREEPLTLMELATLGARVLRKKGLLTDEDVSDEINACTVKIDVNVEGEIQKWLLLFKNETHNHPTEIEPFGGAATCIGGAIRDPLSGRGYVYHAMRVTGAADPLAPVQKTLPGKLAQRKLTTTAAAGFSAYGNQIGLATGLVDEIYHPGYAAKRMEIGAVIGAAPIDAVRREVPAPDDVVVLLGGRTGRDGCGGATGSSKSHDVSSLTSCGAEVQKGNAPEERKLQRLMRNPAVSHLIKRCNDFGAGGVSVAIGELADGLDIDLSAVPRKYEGLDGTELAISESQERMAVVLSPEDVSAFMALAAAENLEATIVAHVTESPRLTMRHEGRIIADLKREFLSSNGARKHASARVAAFAPERPVDVSDFAARLRELAGDLNACSRRGLGERFDATIGAGSILMPYGGARQRTPIQAMAAKIPVLGRETCTCSAMAWGYNPFVTERDPYVGAYLAVVESLSKLVASGAGVDDAHLSFQEYFERLGDDPEKWGVPLAALLGALDAQLDLGVGAIGGKDSMSGSFESIHVPPTLVSFAVSTADAADILSPEFKHAGSRVVLLTPEYDERGLPSPDRLKAIFKEVKRLNRDGHLLSAWTPGYGGIAEGVLKMAMGNRVGFEFNEGFEPKRAFEHRYGSFILELTDDAPDVGEPLGKTTKEYTIAAAETVISLDEIEEIYENKLEGVFPVRIGEGERVELRDHRTNDRAKPVVRVVKPRALIPVFPGTNCEWDTARALSLAGAQPEVVVIRNLTPRDVAESAAQMRAAIERSQIVVLPGGFSGGDEPEGSGKFITAFFRNPAIADAVRALLGNRDGLIGGICNGFQALIKLGLVPYGEICTPGADAATLTYNRIGRHQSRLVRVRVVSNRSPWLMHAEVGDTQLVPVSHGEGRFVCPPSLFETLNTAGQIATAYADEQGYPSMDISANPNGSYMAVEGITSPDGRVFGKMAHCERYGKYLYKNVPGRDGSAIFRGAVDYFL